MARPSGTRRLQVFGSSEAPERSLLESLVDRVTPPSLDPREILREHLRLDGALVEYLQRHFEPFGFELQPAVARDRYAPIERPHTVAIGERVEVALLQIPSWIVANGNQVGTVDEIRTAFEGKVVRVLSPGSDAPSLALPQMFKDWRKRYEIDARFVPWSYVEEMERGYEVPQVFDLSVERPPGPGQGVAAGTAAPAARTGVFISYSHRDGEWLERLKVHLKPLLAKLRHDRPDLGEVPVWSDTEIEPGERWRQEIEAALASTKVAVLLVSRHFLASDFITRDEVPPLLEAAGKEGLRILWILLDAANWEATPIADFQAALRPIRRLDALDEDDQEEQLKRLSQVIVGCLEE